MSSTLVVFAIRVLEGIFVAGMAGCVLVFILSGIDDLRVLLGHDETPATNAANSHQVAATDNVALSHR